MAFKAGSVVGEAFLDTSNWDSGARRMSSGVGKLTSGIVGAFAIMSLAVIGAMGKSIAAADDFQKSMSNVATVIDTSTVSTQDMTMSLLRMNPALGDAKELTDGLYQAFSAGAPDAEAALKTTEDAALFAGAALTDTNTAVDVLTTAVNAYGRETISTTKASDIFFTTIKQGKITGEQLAGTIGQSIPLFASTGIELEQLAAGMAAMTKQGVSANESTTQLNAIVNSFLKPSEALTESLDNLGYASGSAFLEAEGLTGALNLLEDQTGGDAAALAELLPNVRALRGAMALTGVGGEEFTSILGEMENATGATQEAFNKQEKTFETLQNTFANLEIVIGNIGKFFVDDIAGGVTTATQSLITFITSSSGAELVSDIIGTLAGAFTLVKETVTPIIDTVGPAVDQILGSLTNTIAHVTENTSESVGGFDLFAGVSQFAASAVRVFATGISGLVEDIGNLIVAIDASGKTLDAFWRFLIGEAEWDEVEAQGDAAGRAFESLANGIAANWEDNINVMNEEIQTFSDRATSSALRIDAAVVQSSNDMKSRVLDNWSEMITGQEQTIDQLQLLAMQTLAQVEEASEETAENAEETANEVEDTWEEAFTNMKAVTWEWGQQTLDMANDVFSGITSIESDLLSQRVETLQAQYTLEEQALQDKLDNELITQEEHDALIKELKDSKGKELDEAKKKAFEANKRNRIADAWIDAAGSIMGWWAAAPALGPIAGPIFAGVMTGVSIGQAVAQTSRISAQQYIPSFQFGGEMPYTGLARINESGGEIMQLPGGTTIIPNDISRNIAANSGKMQNIININNPSVRDDRDIDMIVNKVSKVLAKQMRVS